MKHIVVTGGKGQLANCIREKTNNLMGYRFTYVDLDELDITKKLEVDRFFDEHAPDWCINCAAYTAVDRAESEHNLANKVNTDGAKYLALACKEHKSKCIQISTDFVFDGEQGSPYCETDEVRPLSVYGNSKLEGEYAVEKALAEHFIIRTAWLYSEHGHNFVKTMLRLAHEKEKLSVVCDQIGTPTYAGDLAELILDLIVSESVTYGTYHYSNEGVASWYDFAHAIFKIESLQCKLLPTMTKNFPTPAKRPSFSVMNKSKIKQAFDLEIPHWRDSLRKCLAIITA